MVPYLPEPAQTAQSSPTLVLLRLPGPKIWAGNLVIGKNRPTKPAQNPRKTATLGRLGRLGRKWNISSDLEPDGDSLVGEAPEPLGGAVHAPSGHGAP